MHWHVDASRSVGPTDGPKTAVRPLRRQLILPGTTTGSTGSTELVLVLVPGESGSSVIHLLGTKIHEIHMPCKAANGHNAMRRLNRISVPCIPDFEPIFEMILRRWCQFVVSSSLPLKIRPHSATKFSQLVGEAAK